MAEQFIIKKGDRLPKLRMALTDSNDAAIDLTDATVTFRMKKREAASLKVDASASVVGSATAGVVEYVWAAGDTDTVGVYDAEWVLTYSNGVQTVPTSGYVAVVVESTLA